MVAVRLKARGLAAECIATGREERINIFKVDAVFSPWKGTSKVSHVTTTHGRMPAGLHEPSMTTSEAIGFG